MKQQHSTPQRAWGDTSARALAVCTHATLDTFICPVCSGPCLTKPKRWTACPSDFDWVCHTCSAHGWAHSRTEEQRRTSRNVFGEGGFNPTLTERRLQERV